MTFIENIIVALLKPGLLYLKPAPYQKLTEFHYRHWLLSLQFKRYGV